jgi:hypothetical protein
MMVLGVGGPRLAMLTCLATVTVAFYAALAVEATLVRSQDLLTTWREARAP